METLVYLLKPLLATIVIEEIAALFWREFRLRLAVVVFIMNVVTNPTINAVVYFMPDCVWERPTVIYTIIAALEIGVWVVESHMLRRWGKVSPFRRATTMALVLNLASFLSGFPLSYLGFFDA